LPSISAGFDAKRQKECLRGYTSRIAVNTGVHTGARLRYLKP
jgi:hypothetical protein